MVQSQVYLNYFISEPNNFVAYKLNLKRCYTQT